MSTMLKNIVIVLVLGLVLMLSTSIVSASQGRILIRHFDGKGREVWTKCMPESAWNGHQSHHGHPVQDENLGPCGEEPEVPDEPETPEIPDDPQDPECTIDCEPVDQGCVVNCDDTPDIPEIPGDPGQPELPVPAAQPIVRDPHDCGLGETTHTIVYNEDRLTSEGIKTFVHRIDLILVDSSASWQNFEVIEGADPTLDPNGCQVAFENQNDIWVSDLGGSSLRNTTKSPEMMDSAPEWSQDWTIWRFENNHLEAGNSWTTYDWETNGSGLHITSDADGNLLVSGFFGEISSLNNRGQNKEVVLQDALSHAVSFVPSGTRYYSRNSRSVEQYTSNNDLLSKLEYAELGNIESIEITEDNSAVLVIDGNLIFTPNISATDLVLIELVQGNLISNIGNPDILNR